MTVMEVLMKDLMLTVTGPLIVMMAVPMIPPRLYPVLAVAELQADHVPMVRAALVKNTPLMQSLGRPMRDQIVSMRPTGVTTLEAIDLCKEQSLADAFRRGGERWAEREWSSTEELVDALFLSTLSRAPTDTERRLLVEYLGTQPTAAAISDAMWSACMLPEFMFIH